MVKPKSITAPESTASNLTQAILDSVSDGVFTVDGDWRISSFNRAAARITGVEVDDALGQACHSVFRSNICERDCALRQTIDSGEAITCKTIYIVRPDGQRVPISISTAVLRDAHGQIIGGVESFRDLSQRDPDPIQSDSFYGMISRDVEMRRIFGSLPELARSDSTILILGESGTGKELVARALHQLSQRSRGPLVTVNCGALPDNLLESELFGYKRGAFTDAKHDQLGKIAAAEGGTLFLDEIGDVSPALQARLLRVLQERQYQRLGDSQTYQANLRFVAATNKDLLAEIDAGRFRADLYYRLAVVELGLPPLRERLGDIPLLVEHFLATLREQRDKEVLGISDSALAALLRYPFGGNIRELHNVVEHAFVLCTGPEIELAQLPKRVIEGQPRARQTDPPAKPLSVKNQPRPARAAPSHRLADIEATQIRQCLRDNLGRRDKTAAALGISTVTLWRKLKKYGIT